MEDPFGGFPTAAPEAGGDLVGQWNQFLSDPRGRGMLLQLGLGLSQPLSTGQSSMGHVAQAIGGVGEMVGRNDAFEQKEAALASREGLAAERLRLSEEGLGLRRELGEQNLEVRRGLSDIRERLGTRNAETRERAAAARERSGGLSGRDVVRRQQAEQKAFREYIRRHAKSNRDQLEAELYYPEARKTPSLQKWQGKTLQEIEDAMLADPELRKRFKETQFDDPSVQAEDEEPDTAAENAEPDGVSPVDRRGSNTDAILARARAAIRQGAPKAEVIRRLEAAGIDSKGL